MTAIRTRFIGPTNFRGSRVKVVAGEGGKGFQLTVVWDHSVNSEQNHYRAAAALITKLEWWARKGTSYGKWYAGCDGKGYVFVCAVSYAEVTR